MSLHASQISSDGPGYEASVQDALDDLNTRLKRLEDPGLVKIEDEVEEDFDREKTRRQMFALLGLAGLTDRKVALEVINQILERRGLGSVSSRRHLSDLQLVAVVEAFDSWELIQGYAT